MYNKCRDTDGEWANIFLKDVCGGEAPTDMTSARFLYVDDDHVPELWMDYGYGYAGGEVFTAESGASDKVYISQGSARHIENGNPVYEYKWNDAAVTEEEYKKNLAELFHEEEAVDVYQNVYTYEQCKLLMQKIADTAE